MPETGGKSNGQETQAALPNAIGAALVESAESVLQAHAGFLADFEESMVHSLRAQREAVKKTLELVDGIRDNANLTGHLKLQLSAQESWFNSSVDLWHDMAASWSKLAMRRFDSARRVASAAGTATAAAAANAEERAGTVWGVMERSTERSHTSGKSGGRRHSEAA